MNQKPTLPKTNSSSRPWKWMEVLRYLFVPCDAVFMFICILYIIIFVIFICMLV